MTTPATPTQRPGAQPSCCGDCYGPYHHDGGHAEGCEFRPRRVFDHLDDGVDENLALIAHAMRRSTWWTLVPRRDEPAAVAGELP